VKNNEQNNLRRLTREFNGEPFEIFDDNGDFYMTLAQITKALGYKHKKEVHQLISRNDLDIDEYKGVVKLKTPSGAQNFTVIHEDGVMEIAIVSRTAAGKKFRKWIVRTLREIRRGEKVLISRESYEWDQRTIRAQQEALIGYNLAYDKLKSTFGYGLAMVRHYGPPEEDPRQTHLEFMHGSSGNLEDQGKAAATAGRLCEGGEA